ncbi:aspartate aminotransferase family protein [Reyranella sp. CPCC 100927]|uniref:aspartate aminotransferase family protein n=1 Tax=Reyranella sp. CPCC 100927 TaxID=2599616 RepID=UPI0011B57680|nr:aminotransferase class III-fold pyridoxal phosphate-dependent enzyme [Reyranella sp. CPCC 100927]TWT05638.1 aminotransferase class III-fold pyridoxal phosphate-dependent enzyme [Reyranella sp. CPCC 100927]
MNDVAPLRQFLAGDESAVAPRSQPIDDEAALLADEALWCSHGDTVHYVDPPKLFERCHGSFMYDAAGRTYLDLQMWYSAVNFGYRNERLNEAVRRQLDVLPQVASQYLHREKIELARTIAVGVQDRFGLKGRVHFNVGGAQAVEDSLKIVRNASGGKSLMFAFEGGYHGRTLGASSITSSYRYRRRYGHFGDRAQFVPFPYCFRCPYGKQRQDCGLYCVDQFTRLFDSEYYGVWDPKVGQAEYAAFYIEPIQGTGGYVVPPPGYFEKLKAVLEARKILLVDDEIQMGFYRAGRLWAIENFNVKPDIIVFGKALTNGLNPLSGLWAREALIDPATFPVGSTHSTFNANPMGTAVGLETLRLCDEKDYETLTFAKGAYFLAGLRELKRKYPEIGDVDGMGLALRMEMCGADGFTPDKALVDRMVDEGMKGDLQVGDRRYGLVLDIGGYYKNVVTLAPSLEITREEIDLAIALLDQVVARALRR